MPSEASCAATFSFYNQERLHSALDYLPPVAFETAPGSAIVCQLKRCQVPVFQQASLGFQAPLHVKRLEVTMPASPQIYDSARLAALLRQRLGHRSIRRSAHAFFAALPSGR